MNLSCHHITPKEPDTHKKNKSLLEFGDNPGATPKYTVISVWQSPGQAQASALAKQLMIHKEKKIKQSAMSAFLQVNWPAGTVCGPQGTEILAGRQMTNNTTNKQSLFTYSMKIQKLHQRKKISKRTPSSKSEGALLCIHA